MDRKSILAFKRERSYSAVFLHTEDGRVAYKYYGRTYLVENDSVKESIIQAEKRASAVFIIFFIISVIFGITFASEVLPDWAVWLVFLGILAIGVLLKRACMYLALKYLKPVDIGLRPLTLRERIMGASAQHNPALFLLAFFFSFLPTHLVVRPIFLDVLKRYWPQPEPVVENLIVYYPLNEGPFSSHDPYEVAQAILYWGGISLLGYGIAVLSAYMYWLSVKNHGRYF